MSETLDPVLTRESVHYRLRERGESGCSSCAHRQAPVMARKHGAAYWCEPAGLCRVTHICDCWWRP